jgi:hypothetical protein
VIPLISASAKGNRTVAERVTSTYRTSADEAVRVRALDVLAEIGPDDDEGTELAREVAADVLGRPGGPTGSELETLVASSWLRAGAWGVLDRIPAGLPQSVRRLVLADPADAVWKELNAVHARIDAVSRPDLERLMLDLVADGAGKWVTSREGVGGGRSTARADGTTEPAVMGRAATSLRVACRERLASAVTAMTAEQDKVRELQRTLYRAAKAEPGRRFHALYDKVHRRDVMERAWGQVRANRGAAGIDRITLGQVEQYGVDRLLDELAADLRAGSYRPLPARRVFIPKPGSQGAEAAVDPDGARPDRAGRPQDRH